MNTVFQLTVACSANSTQVKRRSLASRFESVVCVQVPKNPLAAVELKSSLIELGVETPAVARRQEKRRVFNPHKLGRGLQGARKPFGRCGSRSSAKAALNGDQPAARLCKVRRGWRGMSPDPASGFQGVAIAPDPPERIDGCRENRSLPASD